MENITTHFKWSEFACKDANRTPVPANLRANVITLCNNLEIIRERGIQLGGEYMKVTSGYRTEEYNEQIGGSAKSKHKLGMAADIFMPGLSIDVLHDLVYTLMLTGDIQAGGIGKYKNFIHLDIRGKMVLWGSN